MPLFSDFALTSRLARRVFRHQLQLEPGLHERPAVASAKVALYLHIPFCESLCTYCTFHRVLFNEPLARAYFAALRVDIQQTFDAGWQVSQVYIGGGTPTILVDELCTTIDLCHKLFQPSVVSVETNPNHLIPATLDALHEAGVNRLSVGVQSLDDALLQPMNRLQAYGSCEEILPKLALANTQFETFNVDMIFNLPGQTEASLQRDITLLKKIGAQQISWYPLMPTALKSNEPAQPMGVYHLQGEHEKYEHICQALMPEYRLSSAWCFNLQDATAHDEYITQSPEYLGLGSGAFSYINQQLLASDFNIERYIRTVNAGKSPFIAGQAFSSLQTLGYELLIQLFSLKVAAVAPMDKTIRQVWTANIQTLKLANMIETQQLHYKVTDKGRYFALALMREFYVAVNQLREQMREINELHESIIHKK